MTRIYLFFIFRLQILTGYFLVLSRDIIQTVTLSNRKDTPLFIPDLLHPALPPTKQIEHKWEIIAR